MESASKIIPLQCSQMKNSCRTGKFTLGEVEKSITQLKEDFINDGEKLLSTLQNLKVDNDHFRQLHQKRCDSLNKIYSMVTESRILFHKIDISKDNIERTCTSLKNFINGLERSIELLGKKEELKVEELEECKRQLMDEKKKVNEIQEQLKKMRRDKEQSDAEIQLLEKNVHCVSLDEKELTRKIAVQAAEIKELREKIGSSDMPINRAVGFLKKLLSTITTLMYRSIFPNYYRDGRIYSYADIEFKLKQLQQTAAFEKKQNQFQELMKHLEWDSNRLNDFNRTIEGIERSCGVIVNPASILNDDINVHIDTLKGEQLLEAEEEALLLKMMETWQSLTKKLASC